MKPYLQYVFECQPPKPLSEVLMSGLDDLGFESFVESESGLEAYLPKGMELEANVQALVNSLSHLGSIIYKRFEIEGQNWNAQWEADYPEVRIDNVCLVRAPFHPADGSVETEIVINPQMSFGTGHHATTWLMLQYLMSIDLKGMHVLDMGCGTGVLAIAAKLRGAEYVYGVDIEEIAVQNTRDNARLNGVDIDVDKGGSACIGDKRSHLILANINKNVLLADMYIYTNALMAGGVLLLSGFFVSDCDEIKDAAKSCGLIFESMHNKDDWAALRFSLSL